MGGYVDENDKLMDRTELNRRIVSLQEPETRTKIYYSDRDLPLVATHSTSIHPCKPILTVENYSKWYSFYLIMPDGSVIKCPRPYDLAGEFTAKTRESAYRDHSFNPNFYNYLAHHRGYNACDQTEEMIVGRWVTESSIYNTIDFSETEPDEPWMDHVNID